MEVSKPAPERNQHCLSPQSESIKELATALAKAQEKIKPAKRSGFNPHFKSSFVTLGDAHDAAREALATEGLSVVQVPIVTSTGLCIETKLMHRSGEWISGVQPVIVTRNDPQQMGSSITYARRQSYMAIVGIAPEDDDAETVLDRGEEKPKPKPVPPPARPMNTPEQVKSYVATGVASPGTPPKPAAAAQTTAWKPSEAQVRRFWALVKQSGYLEMDGRKIVWGICGSEHLNDLKTPQNYEKACSPFEDVINGATDGIDFPT